MDVGRSHPKMLDVGFVRYVQRFKRPTPDVLRSYPLVSKMEFEDFMRYKAIINIDGNGWSAQFGNLLCFTSVIIKVEPKDVEYFYKDLRPWVYYVPVQWDLLDN